jgi:hypothetical protein
MAQDTGRRPQSIRNELQNVNEPQNVEETVRTARMSSTRNAAEKAGMSSMTAFAPKRRSRSGRPVQLPPNGNPNRDNRKTPVSPGFFLRQREGKLDRSQPRLRPK